MAITVLDSKDLITHLTTGETPVPKEVAEDNARRDASDREARGEKQAEEKVVANGADKSTETATPEADDVEGEDGLTPRQKRDMSASMLKAIGKKTAQLRAAEEFATEQYNSRRAADAAAEELRRELAALKQPAPAAEPAKKPTRADFQDDDSYQEALVDFRVKEQLAKERQEQAEARAREENDRIVAAANDRLRAAADLVPDFAEVTDKELNVPGHIAAYMQRSPMFAELGYHFGQHPEVLTELRKLPPAEALVELGVIKSTLKPFSVTHKASGKATDGSEKEPSAPSNGATPSTDTGTVPSKPRGTAPVITPLSAGGASQVEKDGKDMNIRETIADWQKKNQRNLGLRKRH